MRPEPKGRTNPMAVMPNQVKSDGPGSAPSPWPVFHSLSELQSFLDSHENVITLFYREGDWLSQAAERELAKMFYNYGKDFTYASAEVTRCQPDFIRSSPTIIRFTKGKETHRYVGVGYASRLLIVLDLVPLKKALAADGKGTESQV